jgi:vacuolar fusion protein MON1
MDSPKVKNVKSEDFSISSSKSEEKEEDELDVEVKSERTDARRDSVTSRRDSAASTMSQGGLWKQEEKQVFILTSAGKPVFMRHGRETELIGLMGVIQAIIARCQSENATLNQIVMKGRRVVFLLDGPIYLVAICRTNEPDMYLRRQLHYLKQQILQLLSGQIYKMLEKRPNYDFRHLMGDIRRFVEGLLDLASDSPHILCESFSYLPLQRSYRSQIERVLRKTKKISSSLLFGVLLCKSKVVAYVEPKGKSSSLPPSDIILIINFVRSSASLSSESAVHFTPVCLPTFNAGFMQTYVGMLNKNLCLLLFSATNDPSAAFPELARCKEAIDTQLKKYELYEKIEKSLEKSTTRVEEMNISGLVHFVYIFRKRSQHFSPSIHKAWNDESSRKRIWKRYKELYCRFYETLSSDPHRHICDRNDTETIVCTRGEDYELLAYFEPLENVASASKKCDSIVRWIQSKETELFVSKPVQW